MILDVDETVVAHDQVEPRIGEGKLLGARVDIGPFRMTPPRLGDEAARGIDAHGPDAMLCKQAAEAAFAAADVERLCRRARQGERDHDGIEDPAPRKIAVFAHVGDPGAGRGFPAIVEPRLREARGGLVRRGASLPPEKSHKRRAPPAWRARPRAAAMISSAARSPDSMAVVIQPIKGEVCSPAKCTRPSIERRAAKRPSS